MYKLIYLLILQKMVLFFYKLDLGSVSMGSKYCNIDIEKVKNNFINEQENIIKVFLCNVTLEEIVSEMKGVLRKFNDNFGEASKEYSEFINITSEELCDFIERKSLTESEKNRTFVELYELFERSLKIILEYIHYQKTEIIFHKGKEIKGDILNEIIKDSNSIETVLKKYIDINVNKIMYGKSIEYTVNFICEKTGFDMSDKDKEAIKALSVIRNCIVHNKGFINEEEVKKAQALFAEGTKGNFTIKLNDSIIKGTIRGYRSTIVKLCNYLNEKYQNNIDDCKKNIEE